MTTTQTTQPETRRLYSPGRNQPDVDGELIATEATTAATIGHDIATACPYPIWSQAGQHFCHLYHKARWAGIAGGDEGGTKP